MDGEGLIPAWLRGTSCLRSMKTEATPLIPQLKTLSHPPAPQAILKPAKESVPQLNRGSGHARFLARFVLGESEQNVGNCRAHKR